MFFHKWRRKLTHGSEKEINKAKSFPPIVLIETWIQMATSNESYMAQERAMNNILRFFDSFEEARQYVNGHI